MDGRTDDGLTQIVPPLLPPSLPPSLLSSRTPSFRGRLHILYIP